MVSASQSEVPVAPLEELAYRRSLRVALDVLSEGPIWSQESSAGTGRADQSLREKPTEHVSSPCDSNFSFLPRGDVLGSSGPHRRRQCVQQSLSSSFTCEKDPECKADHKKGLRKSENPRGLSVLSAGGGAQDESGSRIHCKNWTLATSLCPQPLRPRPPQSPENALRRRGCAWMAARGRLPRSWSPGQQETHHPPGRSPESL